MPPFGLLEEQSESNQSRPAFVLGRSERWSFANTRAAQDRAGPRLLATTVSRDGDCVVAQYGRQRRFASRAEKQFGGACAQIQCHHASGIGLLSTECSSCRKYRQRSVIA